MKFWKKKKLNKWKTNWNLELWTDIHRVRFGRTELSLSGSDAEFWDLSFEKGPRLPGSHLDRKQVEKLFEKLHFSSFWRFFVTKSVGLRFYELSLSVSDAEFWDLSFAMGPGAQFFQTHIIFFKKLSILGTFWESKMGKKVKCLMKWVRLAPNELKLCRNDQARIGTSKMLVLANISQFFRGKNRFFFFWPFSGSTGPPISPY